MRISGDSIELLIQLLTSVATQIALGAKACALEEERNTLFDRDISSAFDSFLQSSGPSLLSVDTLHTALNGIPNEAFTELIRRLQANLEG